MGPDLLSPEAAALLLSIVARWLLAALRLVPLTLTLPLLGGRLIPAQARVPVLLAFAFGLLPTLADLGAPAVPLTAALLPAAVRELGVGLTLALVLSAPFFALEHAGRLLDTARGANAAELVAPDSGERSSPLAELLRWTFGVVFLAAGGLRAILRVVAASYDAVPPGVPAGTAGVFHLDRLAETASRWTAETLSAGLTLAAAGLLALLAVELAFALAARLSPPLAQSNLALPARVLAPLAALALAAGALSRAAQDLSVDALSAARALWP